MASRKEKTNPNSKADDEEDDYMTMTFPEPVTKGETSLQRRQRLVREGEERGRPKSKAQKAREAEAAREAALDTSLDKSNKGFKMMQNLGFKGGALGKEGSDALTEPIRLVKKDDRGGIGLDSEKKRKIREQGEQAGSESKKVKSDEDEFRKRMMHQARVRKLETQIIDAMRVAESLDEVAKARVSQESDDKGQKSGQKIPPSKPQEKVNVLWRILKLYRLKEKQQQHSRAASDKRLVRLPKFDDPDEDEDYMTAFGLGELEMLNDDDVELAEFNALDPETRLGKLVQHMRQEHNYCYWCQYQYPDENMEGCPGPSEDDHD